MRTAVVTGAGRGLGRYIAQGLVRKGYAVLLTDIDERTAADAAQRMGQHAWSMAQDVRDAGSHSRIAQAALARGPLAIWVNNAGVLHSGHAWQLGESVIRQEVEVNLLGMIWGARAAVEAMRERGGHIINIASISGLVPAPGLAVYGATKQAVLGFSLSLQGDLMHAGLPIRVTAVCPDAMDTDMVRHVSADKDAALLFSARHPLQPQDMAARVMELVDRPRLMATYPWHRALMAHVLRPFPGVALRLLGQFRKLGERHQRERRRA